MITVAPKVNQAKPSLKLDLNNLTEEDINDVYDIKGRQIATLMNSFQFAGYYSLIWDASNSPSGVYFIDMTSDGFKQTKQVVLMK